MTRPAISPAIAPGPGDASPPEPERTGCRGCDYGRLLTCPRCETIHCTDCGEVMAHGCEPCTWCLRIMRTPDGLAMTLRRYARDCGDQITTGELFRLADELDGEVG